MFTVRQKSVLNLLLGLALLVAGGVNLFTVIVDNDDDEDTPPVQVELNFVGEKKTVAVVKTDAQHRLTGYACTESAERMMSSLDSQPTLGPGKGSPQLTVPLRT